MMQNATQSFVYQEKRIPFLVRAIKFRIYDYFTRHSSPLFLRGGDCISTAPIVAGTYENELVNLIGSISRAGCDTALIDIGANIGLTTFYTRQFFKKAYCFEPNPRVHAVLSANLFGLKDTHLFNFGLGEKDEQATLTIPKINYGGAFIMHPSNSYTMDELVSKDGFSDFQKANYEELKVEIRKGRDILTKIFSEFTGGFVIKIDVEGFEQTVLKEIAAALPEGRPFAIVFENWSKTTNPIDFARENFKQPIHVSKLASTIEAKSGKLKKLWSLMTHGRKYYLTDRPYHWIGAVVFSSPNLEIN